MARTPNFKFERQERDRQKAQRLAEKAAAKRTQRSAAEPVPPGFTDDGEPTS